VNIKPNRFKKGSVYQPIIRRPSVGPISSGDENLEPARPGLISVLTQEPIQQPVYQQGIREASQSPLPKVTMENPRSYVPFVQPVSAQPLPPVPQQLNAVVSQSLPMKTLSNPVAVDPALQLLQKSVQQEGVTPITLPVPIISSQSTQSPIEPVWSQPSAPSNYDLNLPESAPMPFEQAFEFSRQSALKQVQKKADAPLAGISKTARTTVHKRYVEPIKPVWSQSHLAQGGPSNVSTIPQVAPLSPKQSWWPRMPGNISRRTIIAKPNFKNLRLAYSKLFKLFLDRCLRLNMRTKLSAAAFAIVLIISVIFYSLANQPKTSVIKAQASANALSVSNSSDKSSSTQLANSPSATLSNTKTSTSTSSESDALSFEPAVPIGENQLADLGEQAYDRAHETYTFDDLFMAQPLQVSEEKPVGKESASDLLISAARSVKATTPIPTSVDVGYMNSLSSDKQQVVLYYTDGLLIYIQSDYSHTPAEWAQYLESLQQP
jgi:hypothetical protein